VQKLKSAPRGFTLGIKTELQKIFSICPKLVINAELYGLVLAPRLEKGYQLTYLQFSVIKWAKRRPGQNPFDVKSDEAIQI
jgi:hypothetical protein